MVLLRFDVKDEKVRRFLRRYPAFVEGALKRVLRDTLAFHVRTMQRSFGPFRARPYSDRLRLRTGRTRASIGFTLRLGGLEGIVQANGPHVRIQEFGGRIRPVRARFLRIPLPGILTGAGAIRGRFLLRRSGRGFVTDAGPTFIRRNKAGRAFIFVKDGGRLRALYALRRSVRIPPRFGFVRRFRKEAVPFARRRLRIEAVAAGRRAKQ